MHFDYCMKLRASDKESDRILFQMASMGILGRLMTALKEHLATTGQDVSPSVNQLLKISVQL